MEKEIVIALEGYEDVFDFIKSKIDNIELEKDAEKAKVLVEIDEKYEVRLEKFKNALAEVSTTKIVEEEPVVETEPSIVIEEA